MKRMTRIFLAAIFALATANFVHAQGTIYTLSDIALDSTSGRVAGVSLTWLNYPAALHYGPAAAGGMFREGDLLTTASDTGNGDFFQAVTALHTAPSSADTRYDIVSDHYVVPYFYTEVIMPEEELPRRERGKLVEGQTIPGRPGYKLVRRYYDPMGFGGFGGGAYIGWKDFRGSTKYGGLAWDDPYFYLGTTGRGIVANPR